MLEYKPQGDTMHYGIDEIMIKYINNTDSFKKKRARNKESHVIFLTRKERKAKQKI
jgi:hypothetical protein